MSAKLIQIGTCLILSTEIAWMDIFDGGIEVGLRSHTESEGNIEIDMSEDCSQKEIEAQFENAAIKWQESILTK